MGHIGQRKQVNRRIKKSHMANLESMSHMSRASNKDGEEKLALDENRRENEPMDHDKLDRLVAEIANDIPVIPVTPNDDADHKQPGALHPARLLLLRGDFPEGNETLIQERDEIALPGFVVPLLDHGLTSGSFNGQRTIYLKDGKRERWLWAIDLEQEGAWPYILRWAACVRRTGSSAPFGGQYEGVVWSDGPRMWSSHPSVRERFLAVFGITHEDM